MTVRVTVLPLLKSFTFAHTLIQALCVKWDFEYVCQEVSALHDPWIPAGWDAHTGYNKKLHTYTLFENYQAKFIHQIFLDFLK